jgi:hypothetical protein
VVEVGIDNVNDIQQRIASLAGKADVIYVAGLEPDPAGHSRRCRSSASGRHPDRQLGRQSGS